MTKMSISGIDLGSTFSMLGGIAGNIARRVLRARTWADEDVVQETLEEYVRTGKGKDEIKNPEGWVSRVARNKAIDSYRADRRYVLVDDWNAYDSECPSYIEEDSDKRSAYRLMMAVLPRSAEGQQQREILRLAASGMSVKEIAKHLKISKPFVTEQLHSLKLLIELTEQACQRGSGTISERQRLILLYVKRGEMGKGIARRLCISEAQVSKELEKVREILANLTQGPRDDGGGGGVSQSKRASGKQGSRGMHRQPAGLAVVRSLLRLPAFQELNREEYSDSASVKAFTMVESLPWRTRSEHILDSTVALLLAIVEIFAGRCSIKRSLQNGNDSLCSDGQRHSLFGGGAERWREKNEKERSLSCKKNRNLTLLVKTPSVQATDTDGDGLSDVDGVSTCVRAQTWNCETHGWCGTHLIMADPKSTVLLTCTAGSMGSKFMAPIKDMGGNAEPRDSKVTVYVRVEGGWWTKPYWFTPLTNIRPDGSWECDITTGGVDQLDSNANVEAIGTPQSSASFPTMGQ